MNMDGRDRQTTRFNTILFAGLIAVMVLPLSAAYTTAFAQYENDETLQDMDIQTANTGDNTEAYTIREVGHSFAVMEKYVVYDENKNMKFLVQDALNDIYVQERDIRIALDFAVHNNAVMNAALGDTGHTGQVDELETRDEAMRQALDDLATGKFQKFFENTDPVGATDEPTNVSYGTNAPIWYVSHTGVNLLSLTACGIQWGNFHDEYDHTGFYEYWDTRQEMMDELEEFDEYHLVPEYATVDTLFESDYARDHPTGRHGCNGGEFRDQMVLYGPDSGHQDIHGNSLEWHAIRDNNEPNPEVLGYVWPTLWWGIYVHQWHDRF